LASRTSRFSISSPSDRLFAEHRYVAYDRCANGRASQRDIFVADIANGRETPVVVHPSEDRLMAWSKDGRLLFASDRSGSMSLWAQSMADGKGAGEPVLIKSDIGNVTPLGTTSSGALYYGVSSRQEPHLEIARFDFNAGKILSPPSIVWQAAQQSRVGEQYDWSPDDKYLAFKSLDAPLGRSGPAIVIRSMETGVTRILPSEGIQLGGTDLRWAPDSRTLLAGGPGEIHLIDTRTDNISTFKASGLPLQGLIYMPRWSPDGKKIYFAANDADGQQAFFESDPDLKNLRKVASNVPGGLNLTPDGRTIITPFVTSPGVGALAAVPVSGGAPKEYFRGPSKGNIFISPDGKYIALVSATPSTLKLTSASIVPTAGGEVRELFSVQSPLVVGMGMWAPDSKSIFLRTIGPDGQQAAMWRVPVEGGHAIKVDTGLNLDQNVRYVTVSPSGKQIAFTSGGSSSGKSQVWMLENFLPPAK
jgi:Tol biopolymer transport system component